MKKIFAILTAATLALGLFTSCSSEDDLSAPTETWVEKDYTYTNESGQSSQLTCYFMFTESGYENSSLKNVPESSQNGSSTKIKPGLTIVIVPKSDSTLAKTLKAAVTSSTPFICKTFALGDQAIGDDGESDSSGFSFNMTSTKWNVFYYANITSFLANDQLKNPPTPLKTAGYSQPTADSLKNAFSWKRLLANYLLGTL